MRMPSYGPANIASRHPETHPLTWRLNQDGASVGFEQYRKLHGYEAAINVIKHHDAASIIEDVKSAGLKGRGGAGFLTGVKWGLMPPASDDSPRYLICNADEMEPNTWKDRLLMEQLPHLLIEGMMIAAKALNANRGYIFLRGEYIEAANMLKEALLACYSVGLLGKHILGADFSFDLTIHTGAGRYICGEETALINSLEGHRANPRSKPPYPATVGAWGRPTCVNNVETLCNLPALFQHGLKWYKQLAFGGSSDQGTKLMGFSGKVNRPGVWEVPMGIPAKVLFEDFAGGMREGYSMKCWQPGGASTGFLLPEHLSVKMCSGAIQSCGTRMGTGLALIIDQSVSMVSLLKNFEIFFARESCGWCTPCRDGLPWLVKILSELEKKQGKQDDLDMLDSLAKQLGPGYTFCAHAPGAVEPLESALKYFRHEFVAGLESSHLFDSQQPQQVVEL